MKNHLSCLILLTCGFGWAYADDSTTLQVAPSDQIVYPDASQVLNKVTPAPAPKGTKSTSTSGLATTKPLVASTPVPAAQPSPAAPAPAPVHGWFLRWTFQGDEATVHRWAEASGRNVTVVALEGNQWEALQGPLDGAGLKAALAGQSGVATLVQR